MALERLNPGYNYKIGYWIIPLHLSTVAHTAYSRHLLIMGLESKLELKK
jgi:hypothetical protein